MNYSRKLKRKEFFFKEEGIVLWGQKPDTWNQNQKKSLQDKKTGV